MADEKGVRLSNYSLMESTTVATQEVTWDFPFREGARAQFGENINIRDTAVSNEQLDRFRDSLCIKILRREAEPREIGRSIVDITTKDFINNAPPDGTNARDMTKASVSR